jgi:5-methyltetrahydrofolate corrinoid/iron sulfur protein methyltransferase
MYSAIVDAFDEELNALAKGKMPEIENLVYKVMDGDDIEVSRLSPKEMEYVKTTKVLLGQTLYSDSWLEL